MPFAQILARAKIHTVLQMISFKKLKLLGHAARQANSKLPNMLMHSRLRSKASKGRPPKCWTDHVRENLETLQLLHHRARLAQGRYSWRDRGTPEKLLGHTQHDAGID